MWKYIAKRLAMISIVIAGVTLVAFSAMYLAPGDPAEVIALARYGEDLSASQVETLRVAEGFDAPVHVQYMIWLGHLLQLDLGKSLVTSEDVLTEIRQKLPATAELAIASLLISLLIALPAGILGALRKNTLLDKSCMFVSLVGVSIPNFWLGLLLIWFFALTLHMFPSYGYGSLKHIVLPALTLGTSMSAVTARLTRASLLEVLGQEYIVAARARGFDERTILFRHALKNAFLPVVTFAGMQFGYLLGGAVVVETIFSWPGIGKLLVDSIFAMDFSMVQGCVLFIAVLFSLSSLAVDILYAVLDPRIRYDRRD
ncbi:glutathione ABC transporter permease [Methanosarcina sp. 2.H.T.1A.6]|uniref:nickel ABC transporter permease n=1 Tax=unclassified Methanosarcina TaxID=2644672 RepID=UPI000620F5D7|nr:MULTISPECIES: nickel ABC transporter permease [unclassified Methanosarcina]KKG17010.1 glutathione ABC transporter permease [Methanosarcina sp. 2.H.T.1A.3]KKG20366.1 glutathione ABC transporter permease [Methanosarcina sp. 2.H.T.1A.6]KKG23369.1 glutathione ABC transporter permease [Methanosarcina sp. 2.H.T.1A.8]